MTHAARFATLFLALLSTGAHAVEPPTAPRTQWVGAVAPLVFDGGPHAGLLVGLARELRLHATQIPAVLVAVDPAGQEKWRIGSLGDAATDATHLYTHLGRVGDDLVVADVTRQIRRIAAGDGTLAWRTALSDVPQSMCVLGQTHVWVAVLDGNHQRIDARTGRAEPAPRPASCDAPGRHLAELPAPVGPDGARTRVARWSSDAGDLVAPPGHEVVTRLDAAGGQRIGVSAKSPGSPVAGLVGAGWSRPLHAAEPFTVTRRPTAAAITPTHVVFAYVRTDGSARMQSVDPSDGSVAWDVAAPNGAGHPIEVLVYSEGRLLAGHWTWLEVLDATTGAPIRTLGVW